MMARRPARSPRSSFGAPRAACRRPSSRAALATFAPGLVGYSMVALMSRAMYAQGNARTPAIAVVVGWLIAIVLSIGAGAGLAAELDGGGDRHRHLDRGDDQRAVAGGRGAAVGRTRDARRRATGRRCGARRRRWSAAGCGALVALAAPSGGLVADLLVIARGGGRRARGRRVGRGALSTGRRWRGRRPQWARGGCAVPELRGSRPAPAGSCSSSATARAVSDVMCGFWPSGCRELGVEVSVCAPAETLRRPLGLDPRHRGWSAVAAPIGGVASTAMRQSRTVACARSRADVDVVHAHGLRAGAGCAAVVRAVAAGRDLAQRRRGRAAPAQSPTAPLGAVTSPGAVC